MIRINLLGVERQRVRKTPVSILGPAQRTAIGCTLIFALSVAGMGFWFWTLRQNGQRLDGEVAAAKTETERLKGVLDEIKRAEDRRAQLKQRIEVIEDLRGGQTVPVQLLDHVSRSVPDMLWLTSLDQKGDAVQIDGRTTTLISLADFVANLGTNKLVTKPIDIVNSEVEGSPTTQSKGGVELIKFSVKAPLTQKTPAADQTAGAASKGGRGAKAPAAAPPAAAPAAH